MAYGNPSYIDAAAVAIAQKILDTWHVTFTTKSAFLGKVSQGGNFNKGFDPNGLGLLLPIIGKDQTYPAAAVADADVYSAMTLNTANPGTQFLYNWFQMQGNYAFSPVDQKLLSSGPGVAYGNIIESRRIQLMASYFEALAAGVVSTNAADTTHGVIQGIRQVIATANTVGGIDQSDSANAWARSLVDTTGGSFDLSMPNRAINNALRKSSNDFRRNPVDLIMCSSSDTLDIWQLFLNSLAPEERFEDAGDLTKLGIKNLLYRGVEVVMEPRLASGIMLGMASKSWFVSLPDMPTMKAPNKIDKTNSYEVTSNLWGGIGCNDPGCNAQFTGITA